MKSLTFAGYIAGINCSWSFAIITPVVAIDLQYSVISAFVVRILVGSSCVVTTFPFGHTHP